MVSGCLSPCRLPQVPALLSCAIRGREHVSRSTQHHPPLQLPSLGSNAVCATRARIAALTIWNTRLSAFCFLSFAATVLSPHLVLEGLCGVSPGVVPGVPGRGSALSQEHTHVGSPEAGGEREMRDGEWGWRWVARREAYADSKSNQSLEGKSGGRGAADRAECNMSRHNRVHPSVAGGWCHKYAINPTNSCCSPQPFAVRPRPHTHTALTQAALKAHQLHTAPFTPHPSTVVC